jgi:probable rRNA maturation factor
MVIFEKRVPDLTKLALERFVARARHAAGVKGMVDVLVTTNSEMKALNRRFRGKDKPTDVLSFPLAENDGKQANVQKQLQGEIAISAEIAMQNARELGHTTGEEVKILVLHGLLHLRGYDHERDHGQMARRESQLRARLGLPSGLIERSQPPNSRARRNQTQ